MLNAEDPVVADYAGARARPRPSCYRRDRPLPGGVGVVDGWIVADGVERLPLAGGGAAADRTRRPDHAGRGAGRARAPTTSPTRWRPWPSGCCSASAPDAIREAAAAFTGVEHRLEPVAVIDGVRFVNDSQGTQPDAVIAALRAFEPPVVLIAGGRDKGVDLDELAAVVAERAAAAVVIGETGPDLERRFRAAGLERVERAGSMDDAVARADALAREAALGDAARHATAGPATVLLSPAAASFDMFPDYAARGRAFKDRRRRPLAATHEPGGTDEPRAAHPALRSWPGRPGGHARAGRAPATSAGPRTGRRPRTRPRSCSASGTSPTT